MINGLIGFILGGLALGIVMYITAPRMIIVESKSKFGFDGTVSKIKEAGVEDGWKIPQNIKKYLSEGLFQRITP